MRVYLHENHKDIAHAYINNKAYFYGNNKKWYTNETISIYNGIFRKISEKHELSPETWYLSNPLETLWYGISLVINEA